MICHHPSHRSLGVNLNEPSISTIDPGDLISEIRERLQKVRGVTETQAMIAIKCFLQSKNEEDVRSTLQGLKDFKNLTLDKYIWRLIDMYLKSN